MGVPLPAERIDRGLRLRGNKAARLQWSYLQGASASQTGQRWVELAILGGRGRVQILPGAVEASASSSGPLMRRLEASSRVDGRRTEVVRFVWIDGSEQISEREVFLESWQSPSDEIFQAGEARRLDDGSIIDSRLRVEMQPRFWRRAGILPPGGKLAAAIRRQLMEALQHLPPAPGERGRGDYMRGDAVVTNLEFDTVLALLRLGLVTGDHRVLRMAYAGARHCIDRDLDRESGLPFRHGPEHRHASPEPGHVWIQGLLLAGCVFADRELIAAARSLGLSLANRLNRPVPQAREAGETWRDRLRDEAWPLWELEMLLAFEEQPKLMAVADKLVVQILTRWDERNGVLRYGEGVSRGEAYKERAWLTGGILLPALRAHLRRSNSPVVAKRIKALEAGLLRVIRSGKEGMPLQYWLREGQVFSVFRSLETPEAIMILEGLSPRAQADCLRRSGLSPAVKGMLAPDDPKIATNFSMIGRCAWVYR